MKHWKAALLWLPRLALAALFFYAGAIKAFDPTGFLADVEAYRVTGYTLSVLTAYYLPWLEIHCAIALLMPGWTRPAACILTALMLAFTLLLISAWARGLNIDCGCFGQSFRSSDYTLLLIRDLVLLALASSVALWPQLADRKT